MTQGFFQFNNSIINEIRNFATSSYDLLFMSGSRGSAKSETIEKVIPELQDNMLVFQHFCFENTVIDDFLLNFYDALRNFSIAQKISLKKFLTDNFKDKVSHYFKTIDANCIVIVENFEKIDENFEIIDFLSHLASFSNVKIIIITRNAQKNFFEERPIKTKKIAINEIDKDDFKSKLAFLSEPMRLEVKEKFYTITEGLELFLKMSVKYCTTANTTIEDLINEFERKRVHTFITFEEFLITKLISLVPSVYKNLLKTISSLSHPISIEFLDTYKLGDISNINYLTTNFLVSTFKNEYYVKDYFRQYIVQTFSIQEKVTYYKNLIEIYENELTKSPKDRLIRLSRESIRKEIADLKLKIPSINTSKNQKAFSYLGISGQNWNDEKTTQKSRLSEKLNKIKERKNLLAHKEKEVKNELSEEQKEQIRQNREERERNRRFIIDLINSSRNYVREYRYNDSISELLRAREADFDNEFQIEILILLAKDYEYLNEYQIALKNYEHALELAKNEKDSRVCEIEFLIALVYKNLFKIELAKEKFRSIINNEATSMKYVAKANLELGELEQANSNIEEAIACYNNSLEISIGKDKKLACKCYYKLAVLYDEQQDWENALYYYQKNYQTSSEAKENEYYSTSLTNIALIYIEQDRQKEASEFLKLALIYDSEMNDLENMYFSQKELAKLYLKFDENNSLGYYKQALNTAKKLNDAFKEALVYFELGEYYYDNQEDETALMNFFNSKTILEKVSDTENISRINSRINDIKTRIDNVTFDLISKKYDKQQQA